MNKSQRASETQPKNKTTTKQSSSKAILKGFSRSSDLAISRNGGVDGLRQWIDGVTTYLSDPHRRVPQDVARWVNSAIRFHERSVKAAIGMPSYSESVTLQTEAPKDIPAAPLDGYQLVRRVCQIEKLASNGTTAGGFSAPLLPSDLLPFAKSTYFRIAKVTSWTGTLYGTVGSSFAGVQVPVGLAANGTEIMPIWSENWTPIGQGFAGIVTQFPLGDFPQYGTGETTTILNHFTCLGGTGGVTNIPVIFHVEIECLV